MADVKILVIERNPKIGGLVAGQLREKGYSASDVRHGAGAAVKLREGPADLILMDSQVPMGGVKTARILRLHAKYCHIPIIIILPSSKDEARQVILDGQKAGLGDYMLKPFTMSGLQKKIEEVTQESSTGEKPTYMEIREEIRSLTNLPSMPEAHSKLLTLLSKPDTEVDMGQVSRTLELDPALSTRVMRVCKSAYFGFQGSLMKQAVAFLGTAEIRKIVQSAVIYRLFDESEGSETRFTMGDLWQHSLATGMAMEIIGKADKKKTHFLLGVLHDIGKAVFMVRFRDHFTAVLDLVEKENCSILHAENELLGITHADCGGELAIHWDLPGEVRTAIASHHAPAATSQHRRLAAMVHLSDIAVRTMEIGYGGDPLIPEMDPYAKRMQKSVEGVTEQRDDIESQVTSIMEP
jgi:HD-like signal output (HDOD) protein/CheY-like chemotaxis protein